jgi:hypothetical protein
MLLWTACKTYPEPGYWDVSVQPAMDYAAGEILYSTNSFPACADRNVKYIAKIDQTSFRTKGTVVVLV